MPTESRQAGEGIASKLYPVASLFIFAPFPKTCEVVPAHTSPEQTLPHWQDVPWTAWFDTTKMCRARRRLLSSATADLLAPVLELRPKEVVTMVFGESLAKCRKCVSLGPWKHVMLVFCTWFILWQVLLFLYLLKTLKWRHLLQNKLVLTA